MSGRIAKRQFEQPVDDRDRREAARWGAHEALPHTPPRGKPPETPAPFPSNRIMGTGEGSVKGSQAAPKTRALDRSLAVPEDILI
jgi:hypothetical protein